MKLTGNTSLFLEPNTDTDIIIPARFLKRTSLDGFEAYSFFERRYLPETVCSPTMEEKDFVFQKKVLNQDCWLNHPNCQKATFLLTWFNFGCGSSREHAVYALQDFKVIIGSAPQGKSPFADIFRDNCRQNLIRTPVISEQNHKILVDYLTKQIPERPVELNLDTESKTLYSTDGKIDFTYEIPDHHEKYIKRGEEPFEMAKKEIMNDLDQINHWNQNHSEVLEGYPKSIV